MLNKPRLADASLQEALNRLKQQKVRCLDTETSGLDARVNHVVGYVLAFSGDPRDSLYVPFRHLGNENVGGRPGPLTATGWDGSLAPGEAELIDAIDQQGTLCFGHHLAFDLRFLFNAGMRKLLPRFEDTIINAPLLDEYQPKYSLQYCCEQAGVAAKKSEMIADYICAKFPEAAANPKQALGHFWRLAGDDPVAIEYATGDGTSTWQLRDYQMKHLEEQGLMRVHDIESRLIPVLARMTGVGIKIDEERLEFLLNDPQEGVEARIVKLKEQFPADFNFRSPNDVQKWCSDKGVLNWPFTPGRMNKALGRRVPQASFPSDWLKLHPETNKIVMVRKLLTLRDTFLVPMKETHLWKGRVHTTFHQMRGDEYGTVTGRLSASEPNLTAVSKHDKAVGMLHRSIFIPDGDKVWSNADYSQCVAAGTKVMVPSGTKNIEDIRVGDLVYSYDNSRNLVIRKVIRAAKTGVKPVCRVKWITNGRTEGHLDVTADHKIRLLDGSYKTVSELAEAKAKGYRSRYPYFIRVLALRRGVIDTYGDKRNWLWTTGVHRLKESRFVFEQINGWLPENVHHLDGNSLNDVPSNLEGLTKEEHQSKHPPYGMGKLNAQERKARSMAATRALQKKFKLINNHCITHIIPLTEEQPVYDITVEDTHNFIANEVCVHNCEPRLLAHYSQAKVLIDGYLSVPYVDAHTAVSAAMNPRWETMTKEERKHYRDHIGKRINMTLISGGGKGVLVNKYGVSPEEAEAGWKRYFEVMPEVKTLQKHAAMKMQRSGFVFSLLGRRARLNDPQRSYVAINRLLQSGNADIVKTKLVQIDEYLASIGRPVDILNAIHDDIAFQFDETARVVYNECLKIMTDFSPGQPIELSVPLTVDTGEGSSWSVATYGEDK